MVFLKLGSSWFNMDKIVRFSAVPNGSAMHTRIYLDGGQETVVPVSPDEILKQLAEAEGNSH